MILKIIDPKIGWFECFERDHCWSVTSSCQIFDGNRMPPYEFLGNMWPELWQANLSYLTKFSPNIVWREPIQEFLLRMWTKDYKKHGQSWYHIRMIPVFTKHDETSYTPWVVYFRPFPIEIPPSLLHGNLQDPQRNRTALALQALLVLFLVYSYSPISQL